MAVLTSMPKEWASFQRKPPASGYRALTVKEALADPAILKAATEFINRNVKAKKLIGHTEFKTIGTKRVAFMIEPHYHPPGGSVKPWGWHKGASTFINPTPVQKVAIGPWASETAHMGFEIKG